ncbi:MAG: hypothetical protein KDA85_14150 [Planctomycetaceae bacterium]|nr:hypothetical protein [Planctomycetaceae bacterium]
MTTKAAVNNIKVRMYRHGFGDCFLLSYFHDDDRVFSMLIDCGIKLNTKSTDVPIEDVIADLKATLEPPGGGAPRIDVLVATHEHWDHIAFFHPTKFPDFFSAFDIGQVWLAWTENPQDEDAAVINSRLRDGAAALQIATTKLKAAATEEMRSMNGMGFGGRVAAAREHLNSAMDDVLGFYGVSAGKKVSKSGIKYKPNGRISVETEVAMNHIMKLGKKGGVRYCLPGETIDEESLPPGVNVFVLGPPKGSAINRSNPSSGANKETYEAHSIDATGLTGFIDGILQLGPGESSATDVENGPFGQNSGMTAAEVRKNPYFRETYFSDSEKYRQIEHCWLDVTSQFALQLDGAVNNTSLVLAIELADSGKVLLFPGDAQVGSWLSWHDLEWKVRNGGKTETRTAEQLLNKTVLYKVSHHGSHNATIQQKGLEMMKDPELVAMIPEKEKSYNGILHEPLMTRLQKLCRGRVLISADSENRPEDLLKTRPAGISAAAWKKFKSNLVVDRLYVEYTVK